MAMIARRVLTSIGVLASVIGIGLPALASPPPLLQGGDARIIIPVCAYGELLYWRGNAGWACDDAEYKAVKQGYIEELTAITAAMNAITIPPLPSAPAVAVPPLWGAPTVIVDPPLTGSPPPQAPPPVTEPPAPCGCVASWSEFRTSRQGGGEAGETYTVTIPADEVIIPDGKILYYLFVEDRSSTENGGTTWGWGGLACKGGKFVDYNDYPMSTNWAYANISGYLPMYYSRAYGAGQSGWSAPFTETTLLCSGAVPSQ